MRGMFSRTRNIETSFRLIRATCMTTILGCFGFGGYLFYVMERTVDKAQQRLYILASGKVLEAVASDRKQNLPVEARDHIRSFHWLFFTLDPDDKVITENLGRALYLADGTAKRVYETLKESGYYANVISANISQRVGIDSIQLNTTDYPFYFRLFGTETITRQTSIVTRELLTEGYLREVSRSDNNAHGFLIERWSILSNRDLKTEPR
jgi:conjugative transposon TraK protein